MIYIELLIYIEHIYHRLVKTCYDMIKENISVEIMRGNSEIENCPLSISIMIMILSKI